MVAVAHADLRWGRFLMRLSSSGSRVAGVGSLVGLAGAQQRVEHVDPASGECDEGLVVSFALGSFAGVEGLAGWVALDGAEGGLVEDELQGLAAGGGSAQVAHLAGLLQYGRETGGGGEVVAGGEAGQVA